MKFPVKAVLGALARQIAPHELDISARGRAPVVVHLQEVGLSEHAQPIIERLAQVPGVLVLVVVRDQEVDGFRSRHPHLTGVAVLSETRFWRTDLQPAFILSLHPESPSHVARRFVTAPCPRIVMPHGLIDKEAFLRNDETLDTLSCYTGIFLLGPHMREGSLRRFARRFPRTFESLSLHEIGYPKTDDLLHPAPDRAALLRQLGLDGLDPDKPVICYAPTYQREASLQQHGEEIIRTLAQLPVNVIVKLHHVSLKPPAGAEPWVIAETGGKRWAAVLASLEREHPNLRMATGPSANPYLQLSDVLLSDVSGIAYEYLVLDRPVLFFDAPAFFARYQTGDGSESVQFWARDCGEIVRSVPQLQPAVQAALARPTALSERRRSIRQRLYYHPGSATDRAVRIILSAIDPARPPARGRDIHP